MSNTKTGGPAFPRAGNEWSDGSWVEAPAEDGMTLRDYFAAKAMQSIALDHVEQRYWGTEYGIDEMLTFTAERAYQQADAMLRARKS
jgi:hypothetical protein